MKLLMINPNTSVSVTERLAAAARSAAAAGTEIVPLTAPYGVPYIATRGEAAIGARVVLELMAEHAESCDAAMIAAFADPGLGGARELSPKPVVGMAEAAMLTACMLGQRFAIVSFAVALAPLYRECVEYNGMTSRLAAIRTLDAPFRDVGSVLDEQEDLLVELANRTVREDAADVVILAGAPLAGLAARVRERVPVPLVDGAAAVVKQAEALVALNPRKATAGTYRTPAAKPATGLPPALTRWIAGPR